jgi:hypothetical protein
MVRKPRLSISLANRRSWRSPCLKHLSEISKENHRFGRCSYCAVITLQAWSACKDFAEGSAAAKARLCSRGPKALRTARSRRHGSWCRDPGPAIFPGCAERAVSKGISEKDRMDHRIIGLSNHAERSAMLWSGKQLNATMANLSHIVSAYLAVPSCGPLF